MYKINITEEVETKSEIINLIEEILSQVKKGNTSGVYPLM